MLRFSSESAPRRPPRLHCREFSASGIQDVVHPYRIFVSQEIFHSESPLVTISTSFPSISQPKSTSIAAGFLIQLALSLKEQEIYSKTSGYMRDGSACWVDMDDATNFLDQFQRELDRWRRDPDILGPDTETVLRRGSRLLVRISKHLGVLPASLFITDIILDDRDAVSGGGFADIFRALYNSDPVALKRLRVFTTDPEHDIISKKFTHESLTWRQLEHANVLPFLGVDMRTFKGVPSMVAPWMEHGSIIKFLTNHPPSRQDIDRLSLEIVEGLAYLHGRSVVHGDLRGVNILVDSGKHARLADFGLSRIASDTATIVTTNIRGATRWMAPEQLMPEFHGQHSSQPTTATDIYSFACVLLELYTLKVPFYSTPNDIQVALQIMGGNHAPRPPPAECIMPNGIPDAVWFILQRCWARSCTQRPKTDELRPLLATASTPSTAHPGASPYMPVTAQRPQSPHSPYVLGWVFPPRVLLVDDDAVNRDVSMRLLQGYGVTLDVAVDGESAVAKMNMGKYDLVLMDIMMPKLDGMSATSLIRQFDPKTPIISMTSAAAPNEVVKYYSHGMNDILPKPVTKQALVDMLKKHVLHLKVFQQMSDRTEPPLALAASGGAFEVLTLPQAQAAALGDPSGVAAAGNTNPLVAWGMTDEQYSGVLHVMVGDSAFGARKRPGAELGAPDGKRCRFEEVG